MNMKKYVSFDVFDTCLIRRCGRPYKIWDLMADKLFQKDDSRGRLSFTGNRSLAEKKASVEKSYPTLEDIYDELNVSQWGFDSDKIKNLEMETEEQELFPNPEMLKIVNDYRKKNFFVVFISDMYLPTNFVKKILVKYGFCRDYESVFVSGDCNASKYDGKLYDYVLKKTGSKACQWIHYGDNVRSDFRVPKSKGIKANLVSNTDFSDEEKRWLEDACFYTHKHEIELWAGLCRFTRLQNEKSFASTMAIDFIASVYVPYVVYVLGTAKEKGVKTLYFWARDGHIFWEIAKTLKYESEEIECRYLKVSRKVLYACVFYEVNDYELSLVIDNAHDQTVENCLNHIGLEWKSLSEKTKKTFPCAKKLNSKKRISLFKECLKCNDAELLKMHSANKRELFLKYVDQEQLFQQKSAFVDLGWAGSCRLIVNYIMSKERLNPVPCFYWGYNRSLMYGTLLDELYVFNDKRDNTRDCSCANLFFEEYASMNASGSTICYEQKNATIVPVEAPVDTSLMNLMQINETCVKSFAKEMSNAWYCADKDVFLCCGLKQMVNILKNPEKKHIDFFRYVKFENYGVETKMVSRLPFKDFLALLVWGVPASMIWAEAAIKVTFGPFSVCFAKLYKYASSTSFANRLRLWWENRA